MLNRPQRSELMKKWKAGEADEVWKIIVCARDAERADDTIGWLIYILTDVEGGRERSIEAIRQMSGKEIVDGLLAFQLKAYQGVKNGLNKPAAPADFGNDPPIQQQQGL
jgi:hypothetical protein